MKRLIILLSLILINIIPSYGENFLLVGRFFNHREDATYFASKCKLRNISAQVFNSCDYTKLEPGKYGVAFGSFENSEKALNEAQKLAKTGLNLQIVPAGKYIGITASGKIMSRKSRYIIVLKIFQKKKKAINELITFHQKNLFPIIISGKNYENLENDSYYLVLMTTDSRRKATDYVREVFYNFKNLQVLRTGFYTARKKDPLKRCSNLWEKTLQFRKKIKEADKLLTMGDSILALKAYKECLKIFYFHEPSRLKIVKIYIEFKKWKKAIHNIEILEDRLKTEEISYLKYYCKIKLDKENGLYFYRKFRDLYPNSPYLRTLKKLL